MTSRRPGESAASSTRPGYCPRKASSGASGSVARASEIAWQKADGACGRCVRGLVRGIDCAEALDDDAGVAGQLRVEFGRADVDLIRRQQGPLDIVAILLMARADRLPRGLDRTAEPGVGCDHQVFGQVIREARRLLEEQRQVELDSRWRQPFADAAVHAHACHIAAEAQAEAAAEFAHGLRIQRQFARRQQAERVERLERALAVGIEAAERVDAIIEQVDAHWRVDPHRPDIEQRAAQRELARAADLADAGVTGFDEAAAERFDRQRGAALEREAARADVVERREPREQAVGGQQQDAAANLRQPRQRGEALRDDVRVRRELIVGQDLPVRERQDLKRSAAEEAQLGGQPLQFARVTGDAGPGPRVSEHGLAQGERVGGAVQAVPVQRAGMRRGQCGSKQNGHAKDARAGGGAAGFNGFAGSLRYCAVATASMTRSPSKNTLNPA